MTSLTELLTLTGLVLGIEGSYFTRLLKLKRMIVPSAN